MKSIFIVIILTSIIQAIICNNSLDSDLKSASSDPNVDLETNFQDFDKEHCFRAAVYENKPQDDIRPSENKTCKSQAYSSLETFGHAVRLASQNGAQIIVFPEDGVFLCDKISMSSIAEEVPDPKLLTSANNNPCLHSAEYKSMDILKALSCTARENNIYLVANFGAKESCEANKKTKYDEMCPYTGFFMYNTDIVFDNRGNLIGRYRKVNLFLESFDKSPTVDAIHFNTPFGRLGVFTCFDILFARPALELVEKYEIDTALFPTLWYDELPLLSAIQYQDAWSMRNKVNLLAANMHVRSKGTVGSGIYAGRNALYSGAVSDSSRLLVANLPKTKASSAICEPHFNPKVFEMGPKDHPTTDYLYFHYNLLANDTIDPIEKLENRQTICNGKFCCVLDFKIRATLSEDALSRLILVARDSVRPGFYNWHEQTCFLATLEKPLTAENFNTTTFAYMPQVSFDRLHLEGNFSNDYVYPVAAHNVSYLVNRRHREFGCAKNELRDGYLCSQTYLAMKDQEKNPIYAFGLYGRIYENDNMPKFALPPVNHL